MGQVRKVAPISSSFQNQGTEFFFDRGLEDELLEGSQVVVARKRCPNLSKRGENGRESDDLARAAGTRITGRFGASMPQIEIRERGVVTMVTPLASPRCSCRFEEILVLSGSWCSCSFANSLSLCQEVSARVRSQFSSVLATAWRLDVMSDSESESPLSRTGSRESWLNGGQVKRCGRFGK